MSAAGAPPALRVLHVVNAMDMGGAESVVVEHVRHASPGVQSLVCALNGGGRALETVRSLGARTFDLAGAGPVARLARLRALMRAERVDVVNAHNPTGTLYGVPAGRWAGVPAVFRTEHTIHYPRRHSGAYPALEVVLTAMCDRVVCVCEAVRASHTRRLAWAAERFVTVVNGVAEHRPSAPRAVLRAALGLEPGAPAALALGGMRMPKAFDVLLEGFARVVRGGSPAQLVMAGDGALRAALERQAGTLGIADRVRWLGARTDGGDLVEACDLFVVSSRREGLSLSLLEAMRGGRASVVTRVGGNAEAVEDGVTGLVVPAGDAEALARAMGELLGDGARRERMGVEARARWARAFTAERMVRDTEALYHAALGRPAPAAAPAEADACA